MARASRSVWAERVGRWRKSGLTARQFAAQLGVNANTLAFWKYQLARDARRCRSAPARVEFVEITDANASASSSAKSEEQLEVVCAGGRTVRVPRSFDAETLRRLLAALEER